MFSIRGMSPGTLAKLAAASLGRNHTAAERPLCVFICIADHFEPLRGPASMSVAEQRIDRWVREYPRLAREFADSRGQHPQHSFFYPAEDYVPELLEPLASLCRQGLGDVDVHLHHDRDTPDQLRQQLLDFTFALNNRHGLLNVNAAGQITYGFIHGNWALDNSRPDGRWCGVNDELTILQQTGCYADFTMPSAPAACQTTTINSIYYAQDDPQRPKSHDRGIAACAGVIPPKDSLLMVQGPLALDWSVRKLGCLPSLENGDLTGKRPPSTVRLAHWISAGVHVKGREDWIFIKLHTHGAWEANTTMLLGEPMQRFHRGLFNLARSSQHFRYYYVTARELAQLIRALELNRNLVDPNDILSRSYQGSEVATDMPGSLGNTFVAKSDEMFQLQEQKGSL
jgi:hypothetical protein